MGSLREGGDPSRQEAGDFGRATPTVETRLLIGILQANLGTVPRMLAIAGIDRGDLIERARQA